MGRNGSRGNDDYEDRNDGKSSAIQDRYQGMVDKYLKMIDLRLKDLEGENRPGTEQLITLGNLLLQAEEIIVLSNTLDENINAQTKGFD